MLLKTKYNGKGYFKMSKQLSMRAVRAFGNIGPALFLLATLSLPLPGQELVRLPAVAQTQLRPTQIFSFVSDGPRGPGWSRPDQIARVYFADELPALFERTIALQQTPPPGSKLRWLFTGPHAGFTVELTSSKVRLVQRYYNSTGLPGSGGGYPERETQDAEQQYVGAVKTLTVVLDGHLSVSVLVNGVVLLKQSCVFDVLRHQMEFVAPRNRTPLAERGPA